MRKYSIKTIDGNRYEFELDEDFTTPVDQFIEGRNTVKVVDEEHDCIRYFNPANIVSIKEEFQ